MKKKTGFLVLFCCIVFNLSAQFSDGNIFRFEASFADTSSNFFFTHHTDIPRLRIGFVRDTIAAVYLFERNDDSVRYNREDSLFHTSPYRVRESYDLSFLGDVCLFSTRYKHFKFPVVPRLIMDKISQAPKCMKGGRAWLSAIIYKDSIRYEFQQQCDSWGSIIVFNVPGIGAPAEYPGNINDLQEKIKKNVSGIKLTDSDTSFVFWARVSRTGILSEVKLMAGIQTKFSDMLKTEIERVYKKWQPATLSGTRMDGYIRFYIRRNNKGEIIILTPQRLLTAFGK